MKASMGYESNSVKIAVILIANHLAEIFFN